MLHCFNQRSSLIADVTIAGEQLHHIHTALERSQYQSTGPHRLELERCATWMYQAVQERLCEIEVVILASN
jgi:predicted DNA-binding protein with PD1-like motif